MPSQKRCLNRAEQAQFLNSVRALYAAGFEISEELLENCRATGHHRGQRPSKLGLRIVEGNLLRN